MFSGMFNGPPILISPESTAGLEAGAKTGLSTVTCGVLFVLSMFFSPLLSSFPPAATAPVLFVVAVVLFRSTNKIQWSNVAHAIPAFCVLIFIPFTCNILGGVCIGYIMYICMGLFSGELYNKWQNLNRIVASNQGYSTLTVDNNCSATNSQDTYIEILDRRYEEQEDSYLVGITMEDCTSQFDFDMSKQVLLSSDEEDENVQIML
jgi:MFS superfamily sulfate permease-like transporter